MNRSDRYRSSNQWKAYLPTTNCLLPPFQLKGTLYLLCSLLFLISIHTSGQITKAEYFFDTDPGIGNGTIIPFTITSGDVTFTTNIPTTALSQGFHQLAIRVKENGGVWSQFESRGFYITASTADAANIVAAEYFFDTDPGIRSGTPIPVTPGATTNFTVSIPTTSLPSGFHFLAIRTKGSDGMWGLFEGRGFYITSSTSDAPDISAAEYFFDTDPGNGNGIAISITAGATTNFTVALPTTGLQPGFHFLAVRTKGVAGKWGIFESRGFYITGSTTDMPNITKAEYFFDTDPGNGNGTAIPITAGANTNFIATIPITGLTTGFHFLAIRTKGADGKWGIFESRGFYISPINATSSDIVAAEYFIDTDPGEGNGLILTVAPSGPTINQLFQTPIIGVTSGPHKIGMRVKDATGIWSNALMENFNVLICTPPLSPTATSAARCNAGTVVLNATAGAMGTQVYRWYADAITSTVLFTGSVFTTPILSVTTNYFVSVYDPSTLCESTRTTVIASVGNISKTTLNASGSVALCEGANFLLAAPAGFNSYTWANGSTTQQILVTTNGLYSVTVGDGTCSSLPSDPVTFTFSTKPIKPVIQVSGPTTTCNANNITLTAPSGFATYEWSSGETTQSITKNVSGNYSVITGNAIGCKSIASSEIVVTASSAPAKPIIIASNGLALCGVGANVKLSAPLGFSMYAWSTGETTREILVTTAADITVTVSNSTSCQSPTSDIAKVIVESITSIPAITITGSTNLCDGGSVTLESIAPIGLTSIWSTGEITNKITVASAGNYSLKFKSASGCLTTSSEIVDVKLFTTPAKPIVEVTGFTTLCIDAFAVMTAPAGFSYYVWSTGEKTQTLVVKKAGSYSVKVANGSDCYSLSANPVDIKESGLPCTTSNPNNRPPEIKSTSVSTAIEGKATINLLTLLSDDDGSDDIVTTSLRIVAQPASGATATIDTNFNLIIEYNKINFSGIEYVTIQVCDKSGSCTQQDLEIEVAGDVIAYTAVSPNGDDKNEVLLLEYIDIIPDTRNNLVMIYNRWGSVVFEMTNYNNTDRVFKGIDRNGKELPNDNYFYKIVFDSGKKSKNGFITLRR